MSVHRVIINCSSYLLCYRISSYLTGLIAMDLMQNSNTNDFDLYAYS